jgi:L-lactate dehydrogenase complex protein LldG
MSSRAEILKAIRGKNPPEAALPEIAGDWIRYADAYEQFRQVLESVGGRCLRVPKLADAVRLLAEIPQYQSAQQIVSAVPGFAANVALEATKDPHALETVDFAILHGEFGVAENAAIWATDANLHHRAIYFIVQHLALVLPSNNILHNMHEAYDRMSVSETTWGSFISGPSKTADIEQSLVIGAHGPRSLTVFCVDDPTI